MRMFWSSTFHSAKKHSEISYCFTHIVSIAMAGGAPVPVPTSDPDQKILSIADLQREASKKLGKSARGDWQLFLFILNYFAVVMLFSRPVFCWIHGEWFLGIDQAGGKLESVCMFCMDSV